MVARVKYIDILRGVAIILVLVGHISYPGFNTRIHDVIYAFHMPLFFFVSGMTLTFKDYTGVDFKAQLKKRFNRILLPYLIWSILLALPTITITTIPKILYATHQSIAAVSNSSLWFLPVLFLAITTTEFLLVFCHRHKMTWAIKFLPLLFLLLALACPSQQFFQSLLFGHNIPFGLDIVPMASFFILLGFQFQSLDLARKMRPLLLFCAPIVALCLVALSYFSAHNSITPSYVLMAENRYGDYLSFFAAAFSGITVCVLISLMIDKYTEWLAKPLRIVGVNTMIIFIIQKYPLLLLSEALLYLSPEPISDYLVLFLCLVAVLPICVLLSIFIRRRLPVLAGE